MSTQSSPRPDPPAFSRPDSLFLPDIASTSTAQSLLRHSSYSPFPVFPGASADPHGLDQFLLPPDDPSWSYTNPDPASPAHRLQPKQTKSSGLKKVRSFSMIHRPSPLSQPPVSADESLEVQPRRRKRSNTIDSTNTRSSEDGQEELGDDMLTMTKPPITNGGSIRRAFQLTRQSFLGSKDLVSDTTVQETPSLDSMDLIPPPVIPAATEDGGPSTPMSSRSSSNYSEVSSASSTSSSEGIKTPSEPSTTQLDVELAAGKLGIALAAADAKKSKKGSWRGWLGGRKTTKVYDSTGSGSATPSDTSAESSPNASVVSLNTTIPQLTLTPSPSIVSPSSSSSVERATIRGPTIEMLRRMSMNKLSQLRSPSPHPLALALRRQYSNLPDEVAFSIQPGQKVFPFSVNVRDRTPGMTSMQGGMITSLGVRNVLLRLEKGECPSQALSSRRPSDPMISCRPRGVFDFVNRPTYEERNIVLYPNGTFSPISMARPGYGVWDLDFSPYIVALAAVDGRVPSTWPKLPRASIGSTIDGLDAVMAVMEDQPSPGSDEIEEVLSFPPIISGLSLEAPEVEEVEQEPSSSFRNAKKAPQTWDDSSDEESDDDDEEPLAALTHKKSAPALVPPRPVFTHSRSSSSPTEKIVRPIDEEAKKRKAMEEVARARERRMANISGEAERQAEAERYRRRPEGPKTDSRRTSMAPISSSSSRPRLVHVSASSPPSDDHVRRRVKSTYDSLAPLPSRPDTLRHKSADGQIGSSRRYHSFYENPHIMAPPVHLQYPVHTPAMAPMYTHPAMVAFPGMASRQSLVFPTFPRSGVMTPQFTGAQQQPLYLQMQGKSPRSSLARPSSSYSPRKPRLS